MYRIPRLSHADGEVPPLAPPPAPPPGLLPATLPPPPRLLPAPPGPPLVPPSTPHQGRLPGLPSDNSPIPPNQQPSDEQPKPEVNGRTSDPNISEKISKLITRLPQLGKSIKIKKKGEYIPIPILQKEVINETEEKGNEEEEHDLDEITNNASYWTSGFDDEDEDDRPDAETSPVQNKYVSNKYSLDAEEEEDEDAYVPEDPGEDFEPYYPETPSSLSKTSVHESSSLFEKFGYVDPDVPPVLERAVSRNSSKDSDSVHSSETGGLTIVETGPGDLDKVEDSEASIPSKELDRNESVQNDNSKEIDRVENGSVEAEKSIIAAEKSTISHAKPLKSILKSSPSLAVQVVLDSQPSAVRRAEDSPRTDESEGRGGKESSPQKHHHKKHHKEHHKDKHKKHERDSSEKRKEHREKSSSREKEKVRSSSKEDRHRRSDSDRHHRSIPKDHSAKSEKSRHESKDRSSRHDKKDKDAKSREGRKEKDSDREGSKERSESDKKDRSKIRERHSDKKSDGSKEKPKLKDPSQKLIVDTFDFFSLPVKKPKPEPNLQVDARRTVKLPPKGSEARKEMDRKAEEEKSEAEKANSETETSKLVTEKSKPETEKSKPGTEKSKPETEKLKNDKGKLKPGSENSKPETGKSKSETHVDKSKRESSIESGTKSEEKSLSSRSSREGTPMKKDGTSAKKAYAKKSDLKTGKLKSKDGKKSLRLKIIGSRDTQSKLSVKPASETEDSSSGAEKSAKLSCLKKSLVSKSTKANEPVDTKAANLNDSVSSMEEISYSDLTSPNDSKLLSTDDEVVKSSQVKRQKGVKKRASLENTASPVLGHKRHNNMLGVRRNQLNRHTPRELKRRRTTLSRGDEDEDDFIPEKQAKQEKQGPQDTSATTTEEKSVPEEKKVVEEKEDSNESVESALSARPSRNRSLPVRYSPPRQPAKKPWWANVTPKSDVTTPQKDVKEASTPVATPTKVVATPPVKTKKPATPSSAPMAAAPKRVRINKIAKDPEPFSQVHVSKVDQISEPYLSFLKQKNVTDVCLRSRSRTMLAVDPDAEPRFMYPPTMFAASKHGYAITNKKLAGMYAGKNKSRGGSTLSPRGFRRPLAWSPSTKSPLSARKSPSKTLKSPLKAVKSPLKTVKSPLKSPTKVGKSPAKKLLSPLKSSPLLKTSPLKRSLAMKKKKSVEEAVVAATSGASASENSTKENTEPKADSAKKAKGVKTAKTPPPAEPALKPNSTDAPKLKSPKLSLKSPPNSKQTKLSPLKFKIKRQAKLLVSEDKKQPTLFSMMKTAKSPSPVKSCATKLPEPESTNIEKVEKTPGNRFRSNSILFSSNVEKGLSNNRQPLPSSSAEASAASNVLDELTPSIEPMSQLKNSDGKKCDSPIHLDHNSLQDVIRNLDLDLDPALLDPALLGVGEETKSENSSSSTATEKSMTEISDSRTRRVPKLPRKFQDNVILAPQIKITKEKSAPKVMTNFDSSPLAGTILSLPNQPEKTEEKTCLKPAVKVLKTKAGSTPGAMRIAIPKRLLPKQMQPQTRIITVGHGNLSKLLLPSQEQHIFPKVQQQTIRELFKKVQVPKLVVKQKEVGKAKVPARRGRPPTVKSRALLSSPKTPTSPRSELLNVNKSPKPLFSPKASKADQNRLRLQQKSKKLVKESLRNARQKIAVKIAPGKLAGAPLLLGDRKRLSRGAKEKVLTYAENSKTKLVNDLDPPSSDSESENESDNESYCFDESRADDPHLILDTLHEHICVVDGLATSDFDIGNKKFLSNPVSLLFSAEIRRAASLCNCLCFQDEGTNWNDCRNEVPQRCSVDLRTKHAMDIEDGPELLLDFTPDKSDRNIFDILCTEADQQVPSLDTPEITPDSEPIIPPLRTISEPNLPSKSRASDNKKKQPTKVKRTSFKSILKPQDNFLQNLDQNVDLSSFIHNETLTEKAEVQKPVVKKTTVLRPKKSPEKSKRVSSHPRRSAKRAKLGFDDDFIDSGSLSFDDSDVESMTSRGSSVTSDGDWEEMATEDLKKEIRENPGRLRVMDIDLLMNVCEALEVFLTADDHLLLDVGGYMTKDQAFMLGYLCDYDIVMAEKALKLKRTSVSRVPDAWDLDAIINNDVYTQGADFTNADVNADVISHDVADGSVTLNDSDIIKQAFDVAMLDDSISLNDSDLAGLVADVRTAGGDVTLDVADDAMDVADVVMDVADVTMDGADVVHHVIRAEPADQAFSEEHDSRRTLKPLDSDFVFY